jgi:selenide,water dikinase
MRGRARARDVQQAIATMLQSPAGAAAVFAAHGATACTDVTGFGLLGHLLEMLTASSADARLDPGAIPALDGALDLIAAGIASSLHAGNLSALAALAEADPQSPLPALLIDPQTAGGLLAGIPAEQADACLAALVAAGYRAAEIGVVDARAGAKPVVRLDPHCLAPPAALAAAQ